MNNVSWPLSSKRLIDVVNCNAAHLDNHFKDIVERRCCYESCIVDTIYVAGCHFLHALVITIETSDLLVNIDISSPSTIVTISDTMVIIQDLLLIMVSYKI